MLLSLALGAVILPILALILITFVLTCFDLYGWAALTMVGSIALFANTETAHSLISQYGYVAILIIAVAYVAIGLLVMFAKWFLKVRQFGVWLAETVAAFDADYKEPQSRKDISSNLLKSDEQFEDVDPSVMRRRLLLCDLVSMANYRAASENFMDESIDRSNAATSATDTPDNFIKAIHPKMKQHIGVLTAWTFQWPYVLVSMILKNFVLELVQNVVSLCSSTVNRISRSIVARLTKDVDL